MPDLYPVSIWHRSLLALNESRIAKWETKLSIQNHRAAVFVERHHRAAFKQWHSLVENNWKLWALENSLNTDHAFQFTFSKRKGKKKKKKNKFREWLKIKLWNALWYCWVRHIRASVWSKVYFEYCATQNDTLEEVWCSVGGCLNQQTRHAAASARVVCGGVPFQAQARATSITHNALRICIMHQQALNIKL